MKSLITNYWRRILIIIGIVCLVVILFSKILTPKILIEDYVKYGKTVHRVEIISDVADKIDKPPLIPSGMIGMIFVFTVGILFAVFISSLGAKSSGGDKAKKK